MNRVEIKKVGNGYDVTIYNGIFSIFKPKKMVAENFDSLVDILKANL